MTTRLLMNPAVLAIALSMTLSCGVKKEVHQKALDELAATQGELDKTKKERDALAEQNRELEGDLTTTRGERDNLSKAEKEKAARLRKLLAESKDAEKELLALRKRQADQEKRLAAFRDLTNRFQKLVDTGKLSVAFRNGQMVLKLPSGVLFASGKGDLSKGGQEALLEILDILRAFKDRRFLVAGHTDNVPIRSRRFKSNWHLSTARAVSVVQFMIDVGFPAKNVGAAGYGEFDPVAANDTKENKQLNRRIEIILVPDLSELPNLTAPK